MFLFALRDSSTTQVKRYEIRTPWSEKETPCTRSRVGTLRKTSFGPSDAYVLLWEHEYCRGWRIESRDGNVFTYLDFCLRRDWAWNWMVLVMVENKKRQNVRTCWQRVVQDHSAHKCRERPERRSEGGDLPSELGRCLCWCLDVAVRVSFYALSLCLSRAFFQDFSTWNTTSSLHVRHCDVVFVDWLMKAYAKMPLHHHKHPACSPIEDVLPLPLYHNHTTSTPRVHQRTPPPLVVTWQHASSLLCGYE